MKVIEEKAVELITQRANVCKKIKADDVGATVSKMMKYISYFNSVQEFDKFVFDYRDMSDVMIPEEFSAFITPRSVKYMPGSRQSVDLLIRSEIPDDFKPDIVDWVDTCIKWRSYFKKDATSAMTALSTLKVDKSLSDVIDKAFFAYKEDGVIETFVRYDSTPFIPIQLATAVTMLFRDDYFNSDVETIVKDYLSATIY